MSTSSRSHWSTLKSGNIIAFSARLLECSIQSPHQRFPIRPCPSSPFVRRDERDGTLVGELPLKQIRSSEARHVSADRQAKNIENGWGQMPGASPKYETAPPGNRTARAGTRSSSSGAAAPRRCVLEVIDSSAADTVLERQFPCHRSGPDRLGGGRGIVARCMTAPRSSIRPKFGNRPSAVARAMNSSDVVDGQDTEARSWCRWCRILHSVRRPGSTDRRRFTGTTQPTGTTTAVPATTTRTPAHVQRRSCPNVRRA
jgi:hypothetical protein